MVLLARTQNLCAEQGMGLLCTKQDLASTAICRLNTFSRHAGTTQFAGRRGSRTSFILCWPPESAAGHVSMHTRKVGPNMLESSMHGMTAALPCRHPCLGQHKSWRPRRHSRLKSSVHD